ncbi:MAG: 50S ribosomal protein L11 methyltransferase [archaeon]|nr:50S ribosomal protein L11 methyltransferase [archaeon]
MQIEHRAGAGTTGGIVWNAALVLLRLMEKLHAPIGAETTSAGGSRREWWKSKKVLDVGSGTGLIGITAAIMGSPLVLCTDVPEQLSLVEANLQRNSGLWEEGCQIVPTALTWGVEEDYEAVKAVAGGPIDVMLCSDLLFCAIRVDCLPQLLETMERLATPGVTQIYFIFQQRIPWEEDEWVEGLKSSFSIVEEIGDLDLEDLSEKDCGTSGLASLFYEEPPIACYRLVK